MNTVARFQVTEVSAGRYAVTDTRDGAIWTRGYLRKGWAIKKAVELNEAHGKRKYF